MGIIQKAEKIFEEKLQGRSTIDVVIQAFEEQGLFDKYSDAQIIEDFKRRKTRDLLRKIHIVIEKDGEAFTMRKVHNIETWKAGEVKREYVSLGKCTLEEIQLLADRYHKEGRIHIAIGDTLYDIKTGQLLLFKL